MNLPLSPYIHMSICILDTGLRRNVAKVVYCPNKTNVSHYICETVPESGACAIKENDRQTATNYRTNYIPLELFNDLISP